MSRNTHLIVQTSTKNLNQIPLIAESERSVIDKKDNTGGSDSFSAQLYYAQMQQALSGEPNQLPLSAIDVDGPISIQDYASSKKDAAELGPILNILQQPMPTHQESAKDLNKQYTTFGTDSKTEKNYNTLSTIKNQTDTFEETVETFNLVHQNIIPNIEPNSTPRIIKPKNNTFIMLTEPTSPRDPKTPYKIKSNDPIHLYPLNSR